MTRAALYVRVSTDEQHQSAEVQELDGRRFAAARGWEVVEVYRDEGVSGAEWTMRPQIARAAKEVEQTPRPWDILVVRDLDRIGRDSARTKLFLELLHDAGATVVEYSTGTEARGDMHSRAMISMRGIFAEMEREMIAARVRGSHESRARRGLVTGGKVFGYRNVRVEGGVAHEVDPDEARVVVDIFERRAAGAGYRTIAHALNVAGVPPPRAGKRGTGSWSPSVVFEVLRRERYLGRVAWGRYRKGYRKGTKVRRRQVDDEVLVREHPELRIVSDELWARAQARTRVVRERRGEPTREGRAPKYLLSGIGRCATCGGPMQVRMGREGAASVPVYGCGWHRDRGTKVCPNSVRKPVARVDGALLAWIHANVLDADVVANVVALVARSLSDAASRAPGERAAEVARIERDLAGVEREVENLTAALASGAGGIAAVVAALKGREARAVALRGELARARDTAPSTLPGMLTTREIRARVENLGRLLEGGVAEARAVVQALLDGPLTFDPIEAGPRDRSYLLRGKTRLDAVLFASPEGPGQNRIAGPPVLVAA